MRDYENINLVTKDEAHEFFRGQEENDRWVRVYTNEIDAIPLEQASVQMYRGGVMPMVGRKGAYSLDKIPSYVEDNDLETSMENSKLMAAIPVDNKIEVIPLRYTAFPLIQARAGITGSSVNNLRDRAQHKEMRAADRAQCINYGLDLFTDKTLVLIRDNKITAMMSGDENDYAVLPIYRLMKALENELSDNYAGYEYVEGVTSHEISAITYALNDASLESRIEGILTANGVSVNPGSIKVAVRLTSSDVGLCEARITPIIKMDGVVLPIGQCRDLRHSNGASIAKFCDLAHEVLLGFKDSIEDMNRLMNVTVNYPSNCFKNILNKLNLKGYASLLPEMMERIEDEHALKCTAYDIYWYLNELLYQKDSQTIRDGKQDAFKSIKAQEEVAKVLKMDFSDFDHA